MIRRSPISTVMTHRSTLCSSEYSHSYFTHAGVVDGAARVISCVCDVVCVCVSAL